jgi:hypothetical protein
MSPDDVSIVDSANFLDEIPHTDAHRPGQRRLPVFGHPDQMMVDRKNRVRAVAVRFHRR